MSKSSARSAIHLRGVRQHNLKNFDLDLPLNQLIVITGLSGSGKSSLAFDTLFAEGQRRYIETFSPYARQFFDRMDKPQADRIEGIPPAIAIEQRNSVKTTRSTVGTMTEICDYMKMLWPHLAQLHCRQCGRAVCRESPRQIWDALVPPGSVPLGAPKPEAEVLITFDLPLTEKLPLAECLALIAKQGYQRLLLEGQIVRLEELAPLTSPALPRIVRGAAKAQTSRRRGQDNVRQENLSKRGDFDGAWRTAHGTPTGRGPGILPGLPNRAPVRHDASAAAARLPGLLSLTVIQDRLRLAPEHRARFIEACEQAYHFGKGRLAIYALSSASAPAGPALRFSNRLHCASCDLEYREPSPALFSFNHPVGACPACRGFGRVISIDYGLVLPDRSRTLAQGVVKPWQTGFGAECQDDLLRVCRQFRIPTAVPFQQLPQKWQDFVLEGEPGYGEDEQHQWPRAWYGVKGYFRWLESRAYKMHVRVLLSRYRAYTPCPACHGKRFQPDALLYRVPALATSSPSNRVLAAELGAEFAKSAPQGSPPLNGVGTARPQSSQVSAARGDEPSPPRPAAPGALVVRSALTLADFYQLPIRDALGFIERLAQSERWRSAEPLGLVLREVRSRLGYLDQAGLGYLTLDRPTRSLSGGETERVNLTTCLGTRLVNTLFVLDEPSVGLHPRDTQRLVRILEQLRNAGNTVVVVEHEPSVMRAADQIVDLGPGHGATGGQIVFQGSYAGILASPASLTGQYLSGRKRIELPVRRPAKAEAASRQPRSREASRSDVSRMVARNGVGTARPQSSPALTAYGDGPSPPRFGEARPGGFEPLALNEIRPPYPASSTAGPVLTVSHATRYNLNDLTVEIPLGRFVCLTGVSGSGKTTLVREVLLPALTAKLKSEPPASKGSERLSEDQTGEDDDRDSAAHAPHSLLLAGFESLGGVVLVDQAILGKTPRSNPAVYIGAFDDLREFFAQSEAARQRGLNASAFSFNSSQGQCERCRGAGFEKIEMQFLSDVFIRCPDCQGRRYRPHILEVKVSPKVEVGSAKSEVRSAEGGQRGAGLLDAARGAHAHRSLSIADLLEATAEEAIEFLSAFAESRLLRRAIQRLNLLVEVGLGYLKLGQPINTLSGGESQRLKLVSHLAAVMAGNSSEPIARRDCGQAPSALPRRAATGPGALRRERTEAAPPAPQHPKPILFLFDEPTTGLHFDDVRVLLKVFQRLVAAGHSVLVIEHNLEVIKCADWLLDLGPEAGDQGGRLVAQGTPEELAACPDSHTGQALREVLPHTLAANVRDHLRRGGVRYA